MFSRIGGTAAAGLGALGAALVLGDITDLQALVLRLSVFVALVAGLLVMLQRRIAVPRQGSGCHAGLFDCSLPAWPVGAWRDAWQWPVLLAGVSMLPMMAALPLMAAWCRAQQVPPRAVVLPHIAAMFGPALLLQTRPAGWSARSLARAASRPCMPRWASLRPCPCCQGVRPGRRPRPSRRQSRADRFPQGHAAAVAGAQSARKHAVGPGALSGCPPCTCLSSRRHARRAACAA